MINYVKKRATHTLATQLREVGDDLDEERKILGARANNAGDRWALFAILLTLAHKKGARLNRLWFQSLGRRATSLG